MKDHDFVAQKILCMMNWGDDRGLFQGTISALALSLQRTAKCDGCIVFLFYKIANFIPVWYKQPLLFAAAIWP